MHCLPETIPPRPLRQGIKQCKGWHLRRTRLVSVDASKASPEEGARVILHPVSALICAICGFSGWVSGRKIRNPKSEIRNF